MSLLGPNVEVECDTESQVKVVVGENVSIRCEATPGSHYSWSKVTGRTHPPCSTDSILNTNAVLQTHLTS